MTDLCYTGHGTIVRKQNQIMKTERHEFIFPIYDGNIKFNIYFSTFNDDPWESTICAPELELLAFGNCGINVVGESMLLNNRETGLKCHSDIKPNRNFFFSSSILLPLN